MARYGTARMRQLRGVAVAGEPEGSLSAVLSGLLRVGIVVGPQRAEFHGR